MRKLGVLLVAGVLLFSAASCTTKNAEDVSAGSPSTEGHSSDDGGTTTTRRSTTTTESQTGSSDSSADDSAPGSLADCAAISVAVASLSVGAAFASDDQKAELQQQLDEMRAKVPPEIQDDVDTIAEGADNADGIVELGEFLDSDEYRDAMDNIRQYLSDNCDPSDLLPN